MHYAHTDGAVSAIRCLNQSVDEPPDSPALAPPSRCLRGSYQSLCCQKYLEDPLAEGFLRGNIKQGDTLEVHAAGEQLAFKVTQPEQSEPANGSPLTSRG